MTTYAVEIPDFEYKTTLGATCHAEAAEYAVKHYENSKAEYRSVTCGEQYHVFVSDGLNRRHFVVTGEATVLYSAREVS